MLLALFPSSAICLRVSIAASVHISPVLRCFRGRSPSENAASPGFPGRCDAEPCVFQHRHRCSSRLYFIVNTTIHCIWQVRLCQDLSHRPANESRTAEPSRIGGALFPTGKSWSGAGEGKCWRLIKENWTNRG